MPYPIAIGIGRAQGLGHGTAGTRGRRIRGLVGPSSGIRSRPAAGQHGCWPRRADALGPTLNYPSPPVCFPRSEHPGSSLTVFTGTPDGAGTEPAANFVLGLLPTAKLTPPPPPPDDWRLDTRLGPRLESHGGIGYEREPPGGVGPTGLCSCSASPYQTDCGKGVHRHFRDAPGGVEGGTLLGDGLLLPPRQTTAAGDGHGHSGMGGVQRDNDIYFSGCIPGEGTPFPGPPSNRHPGGMQL